jgi:hypothetical protein
MDYYQAAMTLRKVLVELVVNPLNEVEEVGQIVGVVAKNMG